MVSTLIFYNFSFQRLFKLWFQIVFKMSINCYKFYEKNDIRIRNSHSNPKAVVQPRIFEVLLEILGRGRHGGRMKSTRRKIQKQPYKKAILKNFAIFTGKHLGILFSS